MENWKYGHRNYQVWCLFNAEHIRQNHFIAKKWWHVTRERQDQLISPVKVDCRRKIEVQHTAVQQVSLSTCTRLHEGNWILRLSMMDRLLREFTEIGRVIFTRTSPTDNTSDGGESIGSWKLALSDARTLTECKKQAENVLGDLLTGDDVKNSLRLCFCPHYNVWLSSFYNCVTTKATGLYIYHIYEWTDDSKTTNVRILNNSYKMRRFTCKDISVSAPGIRTWPRLARIIN